MLKAVTAADVRKLYSNYLSGAHGELAIVGDFDAAQIGPMLNSILTGWKAEMPYAHISRSVESEITGGYKQIETPDKANAMYFGAPRLPDEGRRSPTLLRCRWAISSWARARSPRGWAIGCGRRRGSRTESPRRWGPRPRISGPRSSVYAICNPANMEKVRKGIAEEIARLLQKGIRRPSWPPPSRATCSSEQLARTQDADLSTSCAKTSRSTVR